MPCYKRQRPDWAPLHTRWRRCVAIVLAMLAQFLVTGTAAWASSGAGLPEDVVKLLTAKPFPERDLGPNSRYLLLVHRRGLLPARQLAQPSLVVAGLRINPRTNARRAAMSYSGVTVVDMRTGRMHRLVVPSNLRIGYPRWSPDGSRFLFTVTVAGGVELWIGNPSDPHPRQLLGPVLNAARAAPCTWMPDGRNVLCQVVARDLSVREHSPPPALPQGLRIGLPASGARGEELAEYYLRSQLVMIDAGSGKSRSIGKPAVFESVRPSPDGAYLLVSRDLAPYSRTTGAGNVQPVHEIWDAKGGVVHSLRPDGPQMRALQWQPTAPATLVWVERREGTEDVMARSLAASTPKYILAKSSRRFAGLQWLEGSDRALFSDYDPDEDVVRVWLVGGDIEQPRLVGTRDIDGRRPGLGRPLTGENGAGEQVVRISDGDIFLRGRIGTGADARCYLARLNLRTMTSKRLWVSAEGVREEVLNLVDPDRMLVLTRHESPREPPNYLIRNLRTGEVRRLTAYQHPVPELLRAKRLVLRYRRDDGLEMSARLYVPPGAPEHGRLPMVLWAYPRRYQIGDLPPALTVSDRFVDTERALRLYFLLLGYAVMDDVAMPVMGNSSDANDTFVEQIVANARAAIDAADATGIVDPNRVGVAGHSYGAFMAANLLAHSHLFKAGVGLSGAYNRTLTPFGFQTEHRTLWEARDTYLKMSPFLYSDQVDAPMLLVHGLLDDHPGTSPMQSQYFYEAIRRTGGNADLLLLPQEGHSYRGRNTVLTIASAMARWFDKYLRQPDPTRVADSTATGAQ